MNTKSVTTSLFVGACVIALLLSSIPVGIGTTSVGSLVTTGSASRTWAAVSLLYPSHFHDFAELDQEIDHFAAQAPQLIDVEVIGQSYEGRDIVCLRLTNELSGEQKAKTLVVAHHHGREQITIEMALRFLLHLLNGYGVDPAITSYLDTEEVYVIPSLNPDALDRVVDGGNHWLRKNLRPFDDDGDGRFDEDSPEDVNGDGWIAGYDVYRKSGASLIYQSTFYEGIDNDGDGRINEDPEGLVDINRNYGAYWGGVPGSSGYPADEDYRGSAGFSEPETRVLRDFASNHRFGMAYSIHSGINATYFPTDLYGYWVNPTLFSPVYSDLDALLPSGFNTYQSLASAGGPPRRLLESGQCGMWEDWMYSQRNTPLPITFELFHDASVDEPSAFTTVVNNATHVVYRWNGIYGYFNPPSSHIDALWSDVLPAFDYLLATTPRLSVQLQSALSQGSSLVVTVNVQCLSARLGSRDFVYVSTEDGTLAHTAPVIAAGAGAVVVFSVPATGPQQVVRIGNEYTGYVRLVVSGLSGYALIAVAGLTIAVVAAVIVYVVRRRHRATEGS